MYDCLFCYKYENQLLPDYLLISLSDDYFHEYLTRARGNRRVPAVRHEFARQSISWRFPINFNNILSYTHSIYSSKIYSKKKIIDSYLSQCNISDCFVCHNL